MPSINNLSTQINQNLVDAGKSNVGQSVVGTAGTQSVSTALRLDGIRTGTLVEGLVLAQNSDGTYSVRISGRNGTHDLRARATLPLIAGERFRAMWDASGSDGTPTLRLSQSEISFLSQIPQRDREIAAALMSRGLPLSNEVIAQVKDAWKRMGSQEEQISPLVELWARGAPMTQENVSLISQYSAMDGAAATEMWDKLRREFKTRATGGEDPLKALKGMRDGDGDTARFLKAHAILMRVPREDVNPTLLTAPFWPLPEDSAGGMTARVFVRRSTEDGDGRKYWQVGFGVSGTAIGSVGGLLESDGRNCHLNLSADTDDTCRLLEDRRGEVRAELNGAEPPVSFIAISRSTVHVIKNRLLAGRGLDVTV